MLFALLFDGNDDLIAAAPAVFQYMVGDAYWSELYAGSISADEDCQTAYVEVSDPGLIQLLHSLESDDLHLAECRHRVNQLTEWDPIPDKKAA